MFKHVPLALVLSLGLTGAALAEEPHKGGTLNFTAPYAASFATLDIQASPNTQEEFIAKAIHRSLYTWDSKQNKPVLELADSADISSDGLTYTYHLLKNAVFHNGKPLTADDFIYSYKRMGNPKNAFPGARYVSIMKGGEDYVAGKATDISGLRKIDDHTLEITFTSAANPGFLLMRSNAAIYPSNITDEKVFATAPVGLGAFKFKEYTPGSQVVVERFDKYYKPNLPYLDRVNIILMAEDSARDVAFRNKEIDVSVLGPTQYQIYEADPQLKEHVLEVAEVYTRNFGLNTDFKPFKDKRVRQAINYAINAPLIVERLAKNKAYPASGWLPLSSPAFDKEKAAYKFDPEKAKALLAEAGYPNGFEFEVTTGQNESWGRPIVEATLPMLKKVGITVKPKVVESSELGEIVPAGNYQAYSWSNESGPDPLSSLRCFYSKTPRSACNYTAFSSPDFDKLFEAAEKERDAAKQTDLLRQANDLLEDEAPVWFFNYNKAVMAYQPWVHGLVPNATELAIQPYDEIWIDGTAPDSRK